MTSIMHVNCTHVPKNVGQTQDAVTSSSQNRGLNPTTTAHLLRFSCMKFCLTESQVHLSTTETTLKAKYRYCAWWTMSNGFFHWTRKSTKKGVLTFSVPGIGSKSVHISARELQGPQLKINYKSSYKQARDTKLTFCSSCSITFQVIPYSAGKVTTHIVPDCIFGRWAFRIIKGSGSILWTALRCFL